MKTPNHFRNDLRGLYSKLNDIAEHALEYFSEHPEKLSSRLHGELMNTTGSVSKLLAERPEIIVKTDRETLRAKLMANTGLEIELDLELIEFNGRCSNPKCKFYLPGPDENFKAFCDCCGAKVYHMSKEALRDQEEDLRMAIVERIRKQLDKLDTDEEEDLIADLPPEVLTIHKNLVSSLKITDAKLDHMHEVGPNNLSSSMLKEVTRFMKSASDMIDRLEGLMNARGATVVEKPAPEPIKQTTTKPKKKATTKSRRRKKSEPTAKQATTKTLKRPNFDELDMKIKT